MPLHALGQFGTRTLGTLHYDHPALAMLSWPYISIRGRREGPTVCVTAGMHGSEYPGIEAALQLGQELDPADVTGHVLIIPVVNVPAFCGHAAHVVPLDGKNPSQVYPGRRDGTVSEVMAAYLFDEVFVHCDALIDLHGGDIMERLTPFTIYQAGNDPALEERAFALAASYGFPVAVKRTREVLSRPVVGYLAGAATLRGIPAIVAEAGGEGTLRAEDVAAHAKGLRAALAHLGITAGAPLNVKPRRVEFAFVFAPQDGIFTWNIDVEEKVRHDQVLGALRDSWGRRVADLKSPVDGEMLFFSTSLAARKGDLLFGLGAPIEG